MSDINVADSVRILTSREYRGSTGIVTTISSGVARVNLDADPKKNVKVNVTKLVRIPPPAAASAAAAAVAAATATAATGNEAPTAAPAPPAAAPVPAAEAAAETTATAVATTTTTPISNIEAFLFTPSQVNDKLFDFPAPDNNAVKEAQDIFDRYNNKDLKIFISGNGGTIGNKTLVQLKNTAIELCLRGKMPSCQKCQSKRKEYFKDASMAEGIVKCTNQSCNHAIYSNDVQREAALTLDECKRKLAQEKEERKAALEARVMAVEVPEEALNKIAASTRMHGRRGFVEAFADFMTTPEMRKHIDCNDSQLQIGSELSHFFTKNTSHDGITNHLDIIRDVLRQWLPRDAAETRTEVLEENANLKKALEAFIERAEKANVAEKRTIENSVINRFRNTLDLVTKSNVVVEIANPADLKKAGFQPVSIIEIRNWKAKSTFKAAWDEKMERAEASAAAAEAAAAEAAAAEAAGAEAAGASAAANAGQAPPTV